MALYGNQWFAASGPSDDSWAGFTESDGDANTFVLEMEGTGTTEVGAGFGITSATAKTFTVSGTVDAVDADGYRRLNDGKFDFNTSPSEILTGAFANGTNTWFWGMKMKDVVSNSDNAFFNFIGGTSGATADCSIYCAKNSSTTIRFQAYTNNASGTQPHAVQTINFQPNSTYYVWLCHWSDGTYVRGGWVQSETDDTGPKNYSDFPSTQRWSVSSTQGFDQGGTAYTFHVQSGTGAGIGQNNANARGEYRLNKFVISTLPTIVND